MQNINSQAMLEEEETYGQRGSEGNEVALKHANANGQNHVICFINTTILCCYRNPVSRVL